MYVYFSILFVACGCLFHLTNNKKHFVNFFRKQEFPFRIPWNRRNFSNFRNVIYNEWMDEMKLSDILSRGNVIICSFFEVKCICNNRQVSQNRTCSNKLKNVPFVCFESYSGIQRYRCSQTGWCSTYFEWIRHWTQIELKPELLAYIGSLNCIYSKTTASIKIYIIEIIQLWYSNECVGTSS